MENDRQKEPIKQAQSGEILSDGKRDWQKYKLQSLAVSQAYKIFDELKKYAYQIADCGTWLKFIACPKGHEKRLIQASFCRCRLCVTCQWRKSLAMFHQVITLIHAHRERYKSDIPLLLTLTVPNIGEDELAECLNNMQQAFKKLMKRRNVKRAVRSWFRGLEITYNLERQDYHPHYHVLLLVPKNYFDAKYGLYIDRDQWLEMWQEVTDQSEITQVDIRRVKKKSSKKALEAVTAEVAKYATKPSSYVRKLSSGDFEADSKVIKALHMALKSRRLVAFGGLFVKIRKELKLKDIEKTDLVNITDEQQGCQCSVCQSTLVDELYKWHIGARQYVD